MFQFLFFTASAAFVLVHLFAYAVRWLEEDRRSKEERALAEMPIAGALPIAAELACSAAIIALSAADLIFSLRKYPWRRRRPRNAPEAEAPAGSGTPAPPAERPIVLLHGAGMRGLSMYPLARKLRAGGRTVHLFTYWPPGRPFEAYARQLFDHLESLRRTHGYDEFDAVGHSAGGLILRRCLAVHGASAGIRRIVTIGTPHGGSELWRFAPPALGRQLRPGCPFLTRLDEAGLPAGVEATAISSDFDQLVVLNAYARWETPGAANHTISGAGHARLIFHPETHRLVREALA